MMKICLQKLYFVFFSIVDVFGSLFISLISKIQRISSTKTQAFLSLYLYKLEHFTICLIFDLVAIPGIKNYCFLSYFTGICLFVRWVNAYGVVCVCQLCGHVYLLRCFHMGMAHNVSLNPSPPYFLSLSLNLNMHFIFTRTIETLHKLPQLPFVYCYT